MKQAHSLLLAWLATAILALPAIASSAAGSTTTYPVTGPKVQPGKRVVFIAENFKNSGIVAVYRGLEGATRALGWQLDIVDGAGALDRQTQLLNETIAARPDAIVFGGFDSTQFAAQVSAATKSKIVLVGWHAAKDPGPTSALFANVATSADDVGKMAADFVIQDAKAKGKKLGVVIFNDDQFSVANAKTQRMRQTIEECAGYANCKVLAVVNVKIANADQATTDTVAKLVATYGSAWNYTLAINDVYFDRMDAILAQLKRTDILNVSAGDGSVQAMARIGSEVSQQIGSVAEPLRLQGYQLADELNRAFAGARSSGFKSRPLLVTKDLLKATGTRGIESTLGFEVAYTTLWSKK